MATAALWHTVTNNIDIDFTKGVQVMNPSNPPTPEDPTPPTFTAPEAPVTEDVEALKAELEAMRAQASENLDKFLRAKAETENVRRRAETDVASAHKFAIERFALEMLAVKDSLERARTIDFKTSDAALEKMFEGIDLTLKLMDSIFQKFALTEVTPAKGDKFDPEKHQAMSTQDDAEVPANHVLMALQKGYMLNNRLLRPALVIVAKVPDPVAGA
jgi:molecular chaperone GrpE